MAVDINREIARVRALPGQNWHAIAFKTLQDAINGLTLSSATTTTTSAAPTLANIGGTAASSPVATPPFRLSVNGASVGTSANLNNMLPPAGPGMGTVQWRVDTTVNPPNISAAYLSGGTVAYGVVFISTDTLLLPTPMLVEATAGTLGITATLPTPTLGNPPITVIKVDVAVGAVTVAGTINDASGYTLLNQWQYAQFYPDGTQYIVTANN